MHLGCLAMCNSMAKHPDMLHNLIGGINPMPRTKGSKNRITASTDFDAQIAKLQKDKAMLEEGLSKTVALIEDWM